MTKIEAEAGHERERTQFDRSSERLLHGSTSLRYEHPEMADQEARDLAREAFNKAESHEKLCTERWEQQRAAMTRIEGAILEIRSAVNKRIGQIPAAIISILMGLLGFVAGFKFH